METRKITVANSLPYQADNLNEVSLDLLPQLLGFKAWIDKIILTKKLQEKFPNFNESFAAKLQSQLQEADKYLDSLMLGNMGQYGYGVFAKQDIPKGVCIGIYLGKLKVGKKKKYPYIFETNFFLNNKELLLDAEKFGNITRFFQHLFSADHLKDFPEQDNLKKIACANVIALSETIHNVKITFFMTTEVIKKNQIIGFDYDYPYWEKLIPAAFDVNGNCLTDIKPPYPAGRIWLIKLIDFTEKFAATFTDERKNIEKDILPTFVDFIFNLHNNYNKQIKDDLKNINVTKVYSFDQHFNSLVPFYKKYNIDLMFLIVENLFYRLRSEIDNTMANSNSDQYLNLQQSLKEKVDNFMGNNSIIFQLTEKHAKGLTKNLSMRKNALEKYITEELAKKTPTGSLKI